MPSVILTSTFKVEFFELSENEQKQARKAIRLLSENPKYSSLRMHRVQGTDYWEIYVNKDIRIIFEQNSDMFVLHLIGHHDILKKY
ncbi:MAG: cytotoxin [Paenibacillaceae bacterium]